MSWIDVVWPMMSALSLSLGLIHLSIWLQQRSRTEHFMFASLCIAVAVTAIFELWTMRAQTPEEYALALRWGHVPVAFVFTSMVCFVRSYFHAGNFWFGTTIIAMRWMTLLPDFLTGVNLNFREITSLRHLTVWGAVIAVPVGVRNQWMLVGQLSILLLIVFLAHVIVSVRRRDRVNESRRVILVCASMIVFLLLAGAWTASVVYGLIAGPVLVIPAFLGVILVMSFELGGHILRVAKLARSLSDSDSNLRESEQRMDHVVHAAGVGLWRRDFAQGELWLSKISMRMLGFSPGEKFERARFYERVHEADRESLQNALAHAELTGGVLNIEYRIIDANDRVHWIAARGHVEFDSDRKPQRLSGVLLDITELRQSEEQFRMVIEAAPTAMLIVNIDGSIVLANRQTEIVFGYSRDELIGTRVDNLVPVGDISGRAGDAAKVAARNVREGRESFGQHKDGAKVQVEIAVNPIQTDQGSFVLIVIADISERKRAEREAALQRDELAHLSRVTQIAELSGSLAHELNQPLTAILSNAQAAIRFMARSPPNLDEVRESLTNIVESDKRAGEVIRRLRAMLRKDRAEYRSLDINEVVRDVLRIIHSDLINRNVEVVLDLAQGLPPIGGDRVQLQQVLMNLIMNARDAMAEIAKDRELTVRTQMAQAGDVEIMVSDAGVGIAPENIERIFSPFVTSKVDGMGLGLAVCTSIINAHHGRLWATNNATRGATLHFCIPVFSDETESQTRREDQARIEKLKSA